MDLTEDERRRDLRNGFGAWVPALIAVAVICMESTNSMGIAHTNAMLSSVVRWSGHQPTEVDPFNRLLRKMGHFTGYGLLGVCFARGWLVVLRTHTAVRWKFSYLKAGLLGVLSAFTIASCDELHQRFLPSRQASVHDVFLDTCGALTLIAASALLDLRKQTTAEPHAMHIRQDGYATQGAEPAYGVS